MRKVQTELVDKGRKNGKKNMVKEKEEFDRAKDGRECEMGDGK